MWNSTSAIVPWRPARQSRRAALLVRAGQRGRGAPQAIVALVVPRRAREDIIASWGVPLAEFVLMLLVEVAHVSPERPD